MKELFERIEALEHDRGRLRQALNDISCEFAALQEMIRILLEYTVKPLCIESDRADSDPAKKKENKHESR